MLLGVMLNILLYGIMVTQTYLYFTMYEQCVFLLPSWLDRIH